MAKELSMNHLSRGFLGSTVAVLFSACLFLPPAALAQTPKSDQWIHVRVESKENKGESVRVNVPIEMAEKVLPAIKEEHLHDGKVHIEKGNLEDVDLRAILDAVRTAKDGEYVTVQSDENNVRVAKSAGYLYVHMTDNDHASKSAKKGDAREGAVKPAQLTKVEIKVPMKVVDALFSAGKDELDVVAALHALSANGDTELVSVKDGENTVRVWIDSKNIPD
jgi:hypothetical protein